MEGNIMMVMVMWYILEGNVGRSLFGGGDEARIF